MLGKEEGGAAAERSRLANLRTCDPHSFWRLSLVVFRAFTYVRWCLGIHPVRFRGRKHKCKSVVKQEKRTANPLVEKYLSRITFDLQARKIIVVIHFLGSINALARWVDGRCSAT